MTRAGPLRRVAWIERRNSQQKIGKRIGTPDFGYSMPPL
jgi:hypothetical protein